VGETQLRLALMWGGWCLTLMSNDEEWVKLNWIGKDVGWMVFVSGTHHGYSPRVLTIGTHLLPSPHSSLISPLTSLAHPPFYTKHPHLTYPPTAPSTIIPPQSLYHSHHYWVKGWLGLRCRHGRAKPPLPSPDRFSQTRSNPGSKSIFSLKTIMYPNLCRDHDSLL